MVNKTFIRNILLSILIYICSTNFPLNSITFANNYKDLNNLKTVRKLVNYGRSTTQPNSYTSLNSMKTVRKSVNFNGSTTQQNSYTSLNSMKTVRKWVNPNGSTK